MVRRFSDIRIYDTETAPTLERGVGDGGNNLPIVMIKAYGVTTKGNGDAFINEKTHTTLNTGGGQAGQGYPCVLVLNDQGGSQISCEKDEISPCLRAQDHGHPPIVIYEADNTDREAVL